MSPLAQRFSFKASGVSFADGYPESLTALGAAYAALPARAEGEASLIRQPDNAHDPNAIEVIAGGRHLGWVPAGLAARLAPLIDCGAQYVVAHAEVLVNPSYPDRPGLLLDVAKVSERESAEGATR